MSVQPRLSSVSAALPSLPPTILTKGGFTVDTTTSIWPMPVQFGVQALKWDRVTACKPLHALSMSFIANVLRQKSEGYASSEFRGVLSLPWGYLNDFWERNGRLGLTEVLAVKADLERRFPGAWTYYWTTFRRLYVWAAKMGVPGFSKDESLLIQKIRLRSRPSLQGMDEVGPGRAKSKSTKNRQVYSDATMTAIQVALLRAERAMRNGDGGFRLAHIVLTYLAMDFGQRGLTYAKLRESPFETREAAGAGTNRPRLPVSTWGDFGDRPETMERSLNDHVGKLISELINYNRVQREILGLDNSLDWPLFPVSQGGNAAEMRKRTAMPHADLSLKLHKMTSSLAGDMQSLFRKMKVPDGKGGALMPTFYSFRDTLSTNLAIQGVPLAVRASALGQSTTQSTPIYDKRGPEFISQLDQRIGGELEAMAQPFLEGPDFSVSPEDGESVPWIEPETGLYLGRIGRCGCVGSACGGPSGTIECYTCGIFRAVEDGPHEKVLDWMMKTRERLVRVGKPEREYRRYDTHIMVVTEILRRVAEMRKVGA